MFGGKKLKGKIPLKSPTIQLTYKGVIILRTFSSFVLSVNNEFPFAKEKEENPANIR